MQENISKKSCNKKIVTNNDDVFDNINKVSNDNVTMKTTDANTKNKLGVTALIAVMEPATESQSYRAHKQPLRSRPSNKIKVLLDSESIGDLYFLQKENTNPFPI